MESSVMSTYRQLIKLRDVAINGSAVTEYSRGIRSVQAVATSDASQNACDESASLSVSRAVVAPVVADVPPAVVALPCDVEMQTVGVNAAVSGVTAEMEAQVGAFVEAVDAQIGVLADQIEARIHVGALVKDIDAEIDALADRTCSKAAPKLDFYDQLGIFDLPATRRIYHGICSSSDKIEYALWLPAAMG